MKFFFISFSFHLSFILIQVWEHYNLFTFSGSSSNPIENECQPIIIDRYHLSSRSSMHVIYTAVWKNSHYNNRLIFVFNRTTKIEQREKAISGCKQYDLTVKTLETNFHSQHHLLTNIISLKSNFREFLLSNAFTRLLFPSIFQYLVFVILHIVRNIYHFKRKKSE